SASRTTRPERRADLVAIVKARASVLGLQDVFRAGTRASRTAALPHCPLAGPTVGQPPVNFEVDAAQMNLLINLIADARGAFVGVNELAVNRNPLVQALGVHDHLPNVLARGGYADRCGDDAHAISVPRVARLLPTRSTRVQPPSRMSADPRSAAPRRGRPPARDLLAGS